MSEKILGISLTQPWATLLAYGVKEWETRQWRRSYEGLIAIHASNSFPHEARLFAATKRVSGLLEAYAGVESPEQMPRGAIVGVGWMGQAVAAAKIASKLSALERSLGNYQPGRWAFPFSNAVPLFEPVSLRGTLMLFDLGNRDLERFLVSFYRERFPGHDACGGHELCNGDQKYQTPS